MFLAIVSAHVLAAYLARDEHIRPDGFVIEGPRAGGHNAPPRGRLTLDDLGQPVFGPRDDADLDKVAALGLPFWLAGADGTPEGLTAALAAGCDRCAGRHLVRDERGVRARTRPACRSWWRELRRRDAWTCAPTPSPPRPGSRSRSCSCRARCPTPAERAARPRLCDLGYLRTPYLREGGEIGYRCPAEPVHTFVRKGGTVEDTVGRACLCNSLTANVELGQTRPDGYVEQPMVTLGADIDGSRRLAGLHPARLVGPGRPAVADARPLDAPEDRGGRRREVIAGPRGWHRG